MKSNTNYPSNAVLPGTLVRSIKFDSLGVVTNAFEEGGIIFYTFFLMPNTSSKRGIQLRSNHPSDNLGIDGFLVEESEFDIVCYLMVGRINLDNIEFFHSARNLML